MRNIKLTMEYDGKRYSGWQRLGDDDKTIQGKIESVLTQMTGEKIEIIGSGRTDSGTHARGQVANFKTNSPMSRSEMLTFLNRYLPRDIVVKEVEEMPERFHARYNATGKKYSYYVWNDPIPTVFERNHSFFVPQPLDMDKMNETCQKLIGNHDFIGFSALKKSKKSTVRTIEEITIKQEGKMLHFTFVGDGFLYKMVRIMMGTLLAIGTGQLPLSVIDEIFDNKVRKQAGETVPAQGLFLDEVYYQ
ncbi:tRNA pseudouridine(38-40) synthase TruA [Enterococcus villorum]|uniref:tRNA pseudouridine synthase A n=2 Tax=Enterococcus villorum TaxID=112904 RepID=A0A511J4Z3_9ENTE|nr:tRNA pseudouridine(38-40) synthase TruA [Enterococcus villorum]EOH93488.1 tRNA pseudouridine(38-40) synthase [Enterococcus villorum ATCC 700913]EOW75439.1 tRNA pseudouridine(38-40) synthase [Enterococcus villorum ATCC 700913]GEL93076.1 tRNA pseudouridine synthase A [Enterococcus villorum]